MLTAQAVALDVDKAGGADEIKKISRAIPLVAPNLPGAASGEDG